MFAIYGSWEGLIGYKMGPTLGAPHWDEMVGEPGLDFLFYTPKQQTKRNGGGTSAQTLGEPGPVHDSQ